MKLMYFDIKGKAEGIRLALAYAGLPFEDYRFQDRAEFMEKKQSGELPYGQVPALFVDGQVLVQTNAILRFIGKKAETSTLYPTDPLLAAKVDAILDQEADMFCGLTVSKYKERFGFGFLGKPDNEGILRETQQALNDEILPRHLSFFEKLLGSSSSGWLAGTEQPSIADFCLAPRIESLQGLSNDGISPDILTAYPRILAFLAKFKALPAVADWNAKHTS